jgi:hypothetical protein
LAARNVISKEEDVERKLLGLVRKEKKTIFYLDELAEKLGVSLETIENSLVSLANSGLIRFTRIQAAGEISTNLVSNAETSMFSILAYVKQLQTLASKRETIKRNIYEKIRNEIVDKTTQELSRFVKIRSEVKENLKKIESEMLDLQEKIMETNVRKDIGEIGEDECNRTVKSLEKDLGTLDTTSLRYQNILGMKTEVHARYLLPVETERIEQIKHELEELWARHEVGEIPEDEYGARKSKLEEESRELEKKLSSKQSPQETLTEILKLTKDLQKRADLKEVASKLFLEVGAELSAENSVTQEKQKDPGKRE